jgi:hypothetical protein
MTDRLYYLLYKLIKTDRKNDQSFFNAYIGLSFLEYLNIASLLAFLIFFVNFRIANTASFYGALLVFGVILLYNYFSFWVRKDLIISKYENQPIKNGKLLIWGFIIISFSLFYVVLEYFVEYQPY